MKILLINIDSILPNLALKKIEKYHINKGDEVIWDYELFASQADKIYVSCIFDWNKPLAEHWGMYPQSVIGGSGYSLKIELPKRIAKIKPRINMGFTTRGCIRNCEFCIVPKKEGKIHAIGDIYDIWDGKSKELVIMDNNILAMPKHFMKISWQLKKEKLKVDFNQGLDHRLLTDEICKELLSLKHIYEIRFAFDDIAQKLTVEKAIKMLKSHGLKNWQARWYVYIGEKDTFDTVYKRMVYLREEQQMVYVMRDRKVTDKPAWIGLAKWGNCMGSFKYRLDELLKKSEMFKPNRKHFLGLDL